MVESYSKNGNSKSIQQRVLALLDENPYLTAKTICEKLRLPYWKYGNYINKIKSEWKSYRQEQRGSNCSSIHSWRGWCRVPDYVDRTLALEVGWKRTKAKNRWLLWSDGVGRMMWFESGRVNVYVRSPANLGRAKQLVSNGFFNTGLIFELRILEQVFKTFKFMGAHYVFDAGQPLPKMTIDTFERSQGIVIKLGDKSHPRGVEVISSCPDWAERNEKLLEEIKIWLSAGSYGKDSEKPYYVT